MALVCDVCETKFGHDDCHANLRVSPPRLDFKALVAVGHSYEIPEALALDLCTSCVRKVLTLLGRSTEICERPEAESMADPTGPSTNALSAEELRQLGMTDDDLRQLGVAPPSVAKG